MIPSDFLGGLRSARRWQRVEIRKHRASNADYQTIRRRKRVNLLLRSRGQGWIIDILGRTIKQQPASPASKNPWSDFVLLMMGDAGDD
jgi:hypothetical protein